LDIRVPAYRQGAGAGAPDIAAQQQEVDDLLDVLGAVTMLGNAHAPRRDNGFGLGVNAGSCCEIRPRQS
jgi:hypothetical protein